MTRQEATELVRSLPAILSGRLSRGGAAERVSQAVAEKLAELVKANYQSLSAGGKGVDGAVWPAISEATVRRKGHRKIGVDTGELFASIRPDAEPGVARVKAGAGHAEEFAVRRPIFPKELPAAWKRELLRAATVAVAKEVRAILTGGR